MDEALPSDISLDELLKWETRQNERYEWIDGTVERCAGGSDRSPNSFAALCRSKRSV
ncbi:MAG: hypothetical protein IAI50_09225 [Candidatus Eremiobacteraeota bacterium]|nr:hypothetical protein [Candidatus Eremiobacteraeota bacterium]